MKLFGFYISRKPPAHAPEPLPLLLPRIPGTTTSQQRNDIGRAGHRPGAGEHREEITMSSNVYKIVEIVGSSPVSIEDAIKTGLARAAKTVRHIGWFEVTDTRGHVADGEVKHFQVTMKVGFTMDE